MCNLKLKFSMDTYVSVHRYAHILSKEFDMKDDYIHCTVGKSCSLFSWATLSLDLRRNRKKVQCCCCFSKVFSG